MSLIEQRNCGVNGEGGGASIRLLLPLWFGEIEGDSEIVRCRGMEWEFWLKRRGGRRRGLVHLVMASLLPSPPVETSSSPGCNRCRSTGSGGTGTGLGMGSR